MTPKKDDMKKIVDILRSTGILSGDYTGKITLHMTQGTIAGIQYETMIRPK